MSKKRGIESKVNLTPLMLRYLRKRRLVTLFLTDLKTFGGRNKVFCSYEFEDYFVKLGSSRYNFWSEVSYSFREWRAEQSIKNLKTIKMNVCRVEDPESGIGMFHCKNYWTDDKRVKRYERAFSPIRKRHVAMPTPYMDEIDPFAMSLLGDWRCAYFDVEELRRWVTLPELTMLVKKWGLRVYEIEVKAPLIGNYQVVFDVKNIISKTDITEQLISI